MVARPVSSQLMMLTLGPMVSTATPRYVIIDTMVKLALWLGRLQTAVWLTCTERLQA